MLERRFCLALEFRDNSLGQNLPQFDPPLVKRVEVPDRTLRENRMLVECNQLAEHFRSEALGKNHVRWPVAPEDAMWRQPCRRAFSFDLLESLSKRERFGLSKDI